MTSPGIKVLGFQNILCKQGFLFFCYFLLSSIPHNKNMLLPVEK